MKINYLFVDHNNGHQTVYHPFSSNTVLDQERVTKWLMQISGATRMGTSINDLLYRLEKEKIPFELFKCPCCGQEVHRINPNELKTWEMFGIEWELLEGVSGNY